MKKNYNIPTTECRELCAMNNLMAASYANIQDQGGGGGTQGGQNLGGGSQAPGRRVF